jgi:hypothetical protein
MEFEQTAQNLSAEDLKDFEVELNLSLPEDFKSHYLKYNGGYPPFEHVKGINHEFTINGFIPIKYGLVPIEETISDYKKSGITFGKKMPFAFDNGDNIYLISLDNEDYGSIYLIESEFLNVEDKKYYKVSNSFTDFLNSFYD